MTSGQQAYRYVLDSIERADTYFAFNCVNLQIDEFKACFPELRGMRSELLDALNDKRNEMRKPNIQIKNQNKE